MNKITVVLKMNRLSVPEKINRSRFIHARISDNPTVFPSPAPSLAVILDAINTLEASWVAAEDGGKTLKATMRNNDNALMIHMKHLAHYVELMANGDEAIVTLAGMDLKKKSPGLLTKVNFSVENTDDRGAVRLSVRAWRGRAMYRWMFCKDPVTPGGWTEAKVSTVTTVNYGDLDVGCLYWFRVIIVDNDGEHEPYAPISIMVS
jgi:hypothetical protein